MGMEHIKWLYSLQAKLTQSWTVWTKILLWNIEIIWRWFLLHWTEIYWIIVSVWMKFYKGNYKLKFHRHSLQLHWFILLSIWSLTNCLESQTLLTNKPAIYQTNDGLVVDWHLSLHDLWYKPVFATSFICKRTQLR